MSQFTRLRKLADAATTVRDIAYERWSHHFEAPPELMFYLDAEYSHIQIKREPVTEILMQSVLQAGFGWRVEHERDDHALYVIVKRRALVGNFAKAQFEITIPAYTELILKLKQCALTLHDLDDTLHIPAGQMLPGEKD